MSQETLETRLDALEAQVKTLQQEVKEKDKQILQNILNKG